MIGLPNVERRDWYRALATSCATKTARRSNTAGYMFKHPPTIPREPDGIDSLLAEMDRFGIERGRIPVSLADELHVRAIAARPGRLFRGVEIDRHAAWRPSVVSIGGGALGRGSKPTFSKSRDSRWPRYRRARRLAESAAQASAVAVSAAELISGTSWIGSPPRGSRARRRYAPGVIPKVRVNAFASDVSES